MAAISFQLLILPSRRPPFCLLSWFDGTALCVGTYPCQHGRILLLYFLGFRPAIIVLCTTRSQPSMSIEMVYEYQSSFIIG